MKLHALGRTQFKTRSEMRTLYALLVACLLAGFSVHAESKMVGGWLVNVEADRFSDQMNVAALRVSDEGGLAIRCLQGTLSLALTQARAKYQEGDVFGVDLRVDRQPVVKTTAIAIGESFVEVTEQATEIIKEAQTGRELAVRISGKISSNTIVFSLANVTRAIAPLLKACPLDATPAKSGDDGKAS